MSDLNRGIMKFEGADSPKVVTVSTVLLLGAIAGLIIWALQAAYALNWACNSLEGQQKYSEGLHMKTYPLGV